jgi:hypothetical protein
LIKEKPFTDKQSIVQFFSSLIMNRDEHVGKLTKNLEALGQKKKEQNMQLMQLRETVQKMGAQYEDLKVKQKNFSTAVIEGELQEKAGKSPYY